MKFRVISTSAFAMLVGGCAVSPENLNRPTALSCIEVPSGIEAHETKGLLSIPYTTRLTAGPYVSELEDDEGTYYRAPPGGIYFSHSDPPPGYSIPNTYDGGIWVSRKGDKPAQLYWYYSGQNAIVKPLPNGASCATAMVSRNMANAGIPAVVFAEQNTQANEAVAGVVANVTTLGTPPIAQLSLMQGAIAGGVGAGIASGIVVALISMDVGKIVYPSLPNDPVFVSHLGQLAREAKPVLAELKSDKDGSRRP